MKHKSTILIIDDEPSARTTLEALLFREGYELVFASNGAEGLEKAAQVKPDLILLDVMMPDMDGFEVCRRLRADPHLAEVPVIMVTALDDRRSRLQGIEAGADDFVSKPFDRVELRARARNITRLNRYRRLLSERARFEWVVEQADDGYLIISDSDHVLYANPQARLYLGLLASGPGPAPTDASEPIAGTFLELARKQYHCEPQEAWAAWPELPADVTQSQRYLVRPESPTAEAFWLQVDLMEMSSQPGKGFLVRLRDITAQINTRIDRRAFHTMINHKLRTPINVLTGFLELLQLDQSAFSEDQRLSLAAAQRSAMRYRNEILDILQYVETPRMVGLDHNRCQLAELPALVADITSDLQLKSTKVISENISDPENIYVAISKRALELILWELLENTRKFHPAGTPTVEVRLSAVPAGIRLQVCDDGVTLSPNQLANMWAPYYQGEKHFTGELSGMGLGLPTVASLVWSAGGTCRAYNREEEPGVVVELVLPLGKNDEEINANAFSQNQGGIIF